MLKVSARLFPIGFIISVDDPNFNPHDFYIDGNWERIKGRVIVGVDEAQTEFNVTGKTGGAKTHTLTISEMPSHNHPQIFDQTAGSLWGLGPYKIATQYTGTYEDRFIKSAGGNQPHNNLQPYQTAYIWKLISYSN